MLKEELFESFMEDTYTVVAFRRRLRLLTSYLEKVMFVERDRDLTIEDFLDSHAVQSTDAKFFQRLVSGFYNSFSRDNYSEVVDYFEKKIEDYPTVRLVLAFFPLEQQQRRIVEQLSGYLDSPVILDCSYDKSVVAGCKIAWRGRSADFSFSRFVQREHKKIVDHIISKHE